MLNKTNLLNFIFSSSRGIVNSSSMVNWRTALKIYLLMFAKSLEPYGTSQTVMTNKLLAAIWWQPFLFLIIYSSGILICGNERGLHEFHSCSMTPIQIIVISCHQSFAQMLIEMPWNGFMCRCLSVVNYIRKKGKKYSVNIQYNHLSSF